MQAYTQIPLLSASERTGVGLLYSPCATHVETWRIATTRLVSLI